MQYNVTDIMVMAGDVDAKIHDAQLAHGKLTLVKKVRDHNTPEACALLELVDSGEYPKLTEAILVGIAFECGNDSGADINDIAEFCLKYNWSFWKLLSRYNLSSFFNP